MTSIIDSGIWLELEKAAIDACEEAPPAHDFSHVCRVVQNARKIARAEGRSNRPEPNLDVLLSAALLHELFNYPKDHPDSHLSGEVCAEEAIKVMRGAGCDESDVQRVAECIRDHSFSKGAEPASLESAILQDADRLDALGAIGIIRWAATCGELNIRFYSDVDPFCEMRTPDQRAWGVDHFYQKIIKIPEKMNTESGAFFAKKRLALMTAFLSDLESEILPKASAEEVATGLSTFFLKNGNYDI